MAKYNDNHIQILKLLMSGEILEVSELCTQFSGYLESFVRALADLEAANYVSKIYATRVKITEDGKKAISVFYK